MSLTNLNLDSLRSIPAIQKVALLGLFVVGILVAFYYYVVDPKPRRSRPSAAKWRNSIRKSRR